MSLLNEIKSVLPQLRTIEKDVIDLGREIDKITPDAGIFSLYITGNISALTDKTKKEDATFKFVYPNGTTIAATGNIKLQGSGSIRWYPHCNYTINKINPPISFTTYDCSSSYPNLYTMARTRSWGSRNKFVLKADHMDHTHARNVVTARIWGEMVRSRTDLGLNSTGSPTDILKTLPNCGAIDGFPIKLYINGDYCGLYDLNISKDENMLGMSDGSVEAILCGEDWCAGSRFTTDEFHEDVFEFDDGDLGLISQADYEKYVQDGTEPAKAWVVEFDEDECDWIPASLNGVLSIVYDYEQYPDGSSFKTAIEAVLDIPSAIDYLIFIRAFALVDNYARNMILAKYENTKWFASAYDMDTAFGIHWSGTAFYSVSKYADFDSNIYTTDTMRLWKRLLDNYRTEIKTRYATLRAGALSDANVYDKIIGFYKEIPDTIHSYDATVYDKKYASPTYPVRPSTGASDMTQLITWYKTHMEILDTQMEDY